MQKASDSHDQEGKNKITHTQNEGHGQSDGRGDSGQRGENHEQPLLKSPRRWNQKTERPRGSREAQEKDRHRERDRDVNEEKNEPERSRTDKKTGRLPEEIEHQKRKRAVQIVQVVFDAQRQVAQRGSSLFRSQTSESTTENTEHVAPNLKKQNQEKDKCQDGGYRDVHHQAVTYGRSVLFKDKDGRPDKKKELGSCDQSRLKDQARQDDMSRKVTAMQFSIPGDKAACSYRDEGLYGVAYTSRPADQKGTRIRPQVAENAIPSLSIQNDGNCMKEDNESNAESHFAENMTDNTGVNTCKKKNRETQADENSAKLSS